MNWLDRFNANGYQIAVIVVAFGAISTVPFWAGPYTYSLSLACIWAIFAMGWSILSGYTGYMSFGHTFISGTAAYTTALLLTHVDPELSIMVTFPVSVLMAVLAGYVFAFPSLRLKGPYFSLITLVIVLVSIRLVYMFNDYTGGEFGLNIGSITYDPTELFYISFVPMLLIAAGLLAVSQSNVGTVFKAINENEAAVESAGLDTTKFKLWAFTYSAVPMGIGGVLIAHFYGLVDPGTVLAVGRNIELIAMAVIGGMSTILGPIGGAFLFIMLRDEILLGPLGSHVRYIVLWTIVLVIFFKFPDGLFTKIWDVLGEFGGDSE
ncbi:branched-chain amino acid ABC transporter permease [Natronorubrum sp. FCH18a]|uniref:branched-chain amino acid ABC transporter permease n=1 Tax=Natronorubrum sp. FCH18a TaxID=3447018 RepID=UPI003F516F9D